MKRLSALLVISLIPVYCFAQTQTGDASYNASKKGLTLAHSSMSFGTRVRITNERNNREVIAAVDDRIPASDPRIADISKEAGDAIGMSQSGYTRVRLEELIPERPAAAPPASPPVQTPPAAAQGTPPSAAAPSSARPQEAVVETIQIVSPAQAAPPVQYVMLPSPEGQNCFNSPLCIVILVLLIVAVLILAAILVLLLYMRRVPWGPWYYPVWFRRHLRYLKKRVY